MNIGRVLIILGAALVSALNEPAIASERLNLYPREPRLGEISFVSLDNYAPAKGETVSVRLLDRDFPLHPDGKGGLEGFIAVERDAKAGVHTLTLKSSRSGDDKTVYTDKIKVAARKFVEQHLTVDEKMVKLSPEDEERAARERVLINKALGARSGGDPAAEWYERPVPGQVSSTFGMRRFYNGRPGSYHGGLDIAAPRGEPVKASGEGAVVLTGDFFFTGNSVFVDHGGGLITAYFHMDELGVKGGAHVKEGDVIGRVGSTGRSTGPHLHWSVYLCGVKVDPESLLVAVAGRGRQAARPGGN